MKHLSTTMKPKNDKPSGRDNDEASRYFDHYWEYAKLWRSWVVGIAVGALFILLNKDVGVRFTCRACISTLFVFAAGIQVFMAWINKTGAYYEYREKKGDDGRWLRFWCRTANSYWIDWTCDLSSLVLVVLAVIVMVAEMIYPDLDARLPFLSTRPGP